MDRLEPLSFLHPEAFRNGPDRYPGGRFMAVLFYAFPSLLLVTGFCCLLLVLCLLWLLGVWLLVVWLILAADSFCDCLTFLLRFLA